LVIVNPRPDWLARKGFKLFWKWTSQAGRPRKFLRTSPNLMLQMAQANPTWGQRRARGAVGEGGYLRFSAYGSSCRASETGATRPVGGLFAGLEEVLANHASGYRVPISWFGGDLSVELCVSRMERSGTRPHCALQRHRACNGSWPFCSRLRERFRAILPTVSLSMA